MRIDVVDGSVAIVSSGSIKSTVNIQLVKGVKAGDYVLVHAGIAIEKVDKKKAKQILDSLKEIE